MNRFTLLLTTLFIISLTACGPSDKTGTADSIVDTTTYDTAMPVDTIPADTIPPAPGRFATSQEALDYMQNSPYREKYEAGILPRMARENLPYTNKLLNSTYSRFLVVDKGKMKVQVYDCYGRKEIEYGIACAKNFGTKHEKGDSRTPEGFFSVEGIYDSTDWLFTDDNGVTSPKKGQFGPRFIRLRIPTTSQIGIHGTCAPWSIGSRASHGCIRVTNENILKLVEIVEVGMPVIVNPGSRDMRVNLEEGYDVPYITTDDRPIKIPKVTPRDTTAVDTLHIDTTSTIEVTDTIVVITPTPGLVTDTIPETSQTDTIQ